MIHSIFFNLFPFLCMVFIEFLRDIHLVSNLLTFIMLQFFLGIGVGVYLGTEYNFRPYVNAIKDMASKIEKRKDQAEKIILKKVSKIACIFCDKWAKHYLYVG